MKTGFTVPQIREAIERFGLVGSMPLLHCSFTTLREFCRLFEIEVKRYPPRVVENIDGSELRKMYQTMTLQDLALYYGCSRRSIEVAMDRHGIQRRPRGHLGHLDSTA